MIGIIGWFLWSFLLFEVQMKKIETLLKETSSGSSEEPIQQELSPEDFFEQTWPAEKGQELPSPAELFQGPK